MTSNPLLSLYIAALGDVGAGPLANWMKAVSYKGGPPGPPGTFGPPGFGGPPGTFGPPGFGGYPARFWPLVLTKGARTMTVVFIVLGSLYFLATNAYRPHVNFQTIETSIAADQTQSAYNDVSTATRTYLTTVKACATSAVDLLGCVEQADTTWAQAIQAYGAQLGQITYPTPAQAEAVAARSAATAAAVSVGALATSPDIQSYDAAYADPTLKAAVDNVDTTFTQLMHALGR